MLKAAVEWTEHAEHQWATEGSGTEKLVMNKYDTTFSFSLSGRPREEQQRRRADYCARSLLP